LNNSPSSILSSAPTMTFSASTASSVSMQDFPSASEPLYPAPQQSVFADIKQWSSSPAMPAMGPPYSGSPTIQSPSPYAPPYTSTNFVQQATPSGGSGSSYRGSMDELMTAAITSASPTSHVAGSMSGLGLDSAVYPQPPATPTSYAPSPAGFPPTEYVPSFAHIYRETRKGQDLGLSLEDFEVLETLGALIATGSVPQADSLDERNGHIWASLALSIAASATSKSTAIFCHEGPLQIGRRPIEASSTYQL
jgi:hypothetical protein